MSVSRIEEGLADRTLRLWPRRTKSRIESPRMPRAELASLLARAQGWFVQFIAHALPRIADDAIADELRVIRESHLVSIGVCRAIRPDIAPAHGGARPLPSRGLPLFPEGAPTP